MISRFFLLSSSHELALKSIIDFVHKLKSRNEYCPRIPIGDRARAAALPITHTRKLEGKLRSLWLVLPFRPQWADMALSAKLQSLADLHMLPVNIRIAWRLGDQHLKFRLRACNEVFDPRAHHEFFS
jgi:hypothetical protein